jgi:hypothetical protein
MSTASKQWFCMASPFEHEVTEIEPRAECHTVPHTVTHAVTHRPNSTMVALPFQSMLCVLAPLVISATAPQTIFVSPSGSDTHSGATPASALKTCSAAVNKLTARLSPDGVPPLGGIEVVFAEGAYPLTPSTACGTVTVQGTESSPVVFRAATADSLVVFNGASAIDAKHLGPVTNTTVRSLLNPGAASAVRALAVDAAVGWTGDGQMLQWGQFPLTPSIWPNTGLGYIKEIYDSGALYCPGRTKGPPPVCQICTGNQRSTSAKPCGANFSLSVAPLGDWERELLAGPGFGGKQVTLEGYLGADWFHETHSIVRVERNDSGSTTVQLGESSHYGVCEAVDGLGPNCAAGDKGGAPGRFHVGGLLSNVDSAGEYFYDRVARVLYMIPPSDVQGELGFWAGPGLITVTNSSFVTVRDITVTGSASTDGAVAVVGGENNTIGGCKVQSCASGIRLGGGHRNQAVGNDVYDVTGFHISTSSNADEELANSQTKLVPTNNFVSNNHFTQVWLSATTWGVHAGGVGDRFNNNVMHDAPGQLILPGGPLTMWDHK